MTVHATLLDGQSRAHFLALSGLFVAGLCNTAYFLIFSFC